MPYIAPCLFLLWTMVSVSSQEKPLKGPLEGTGEKGILFGDDANPSHTWKWIPPHRALATRVPNPMFLSSDARAHRSCTDLPICASDNIVRPFPHCCRDWKKNPQWSNQPVLCKGKKGFSPPNFTADKCIAVAEHLPSNSQVILCLIVCKLFFGLVALCRLRLMKSIFRYHG